MDFQDAVFQALEQKKRNDDGPGSSSSRPNGNSTAAGAASEPTQVKNGHPNGNGHGEPMLESDRSSPAAAPSQTTTAPAKKANGGVPPQLQLPINLGYMYPSGSSSNDSGSRPGSRATSESRSPHRRRTVQTDYSTVLPQIASHHLPPSSPTSPTSAATNLNALGLDTPRPKARSQASYAWFSDDQAGPNFPATQNRTASSLKQRRDMSNSPARTDSRRESPPATSQVDGGDAAVRSPDQNRVSSLVSVSLRYP
jgi:hypothetical protein